MKTESITFHNAQIPCAQDDSGNVFVAIKPICVAIGIDYNHYRTKIRKHPTLSKGVGEYPLPSPGGTQAMFCLNLKYLSGWLFQIPIEQIGLEAREVLLDFQEKCYDVLHAHFFKQTQASDKDRQNAALIEWIKAKQTQLAGLKKQRSILDKAIYETQKQLIELDTDVAPGGAQLQIAFTALLNLPEAGE